MFEYRKPTGPVSLTAGRSRNKFSASQRWLLLLFFSGLQLLSLLRALSQATRPKRIVPV